MAEWARQPLSTFLIVVSIMCASVLCPIGKPRPSLPRCAKQPLFSKGRDGSEISRCRLWIDEPGGKLKEPTSREYETVGYVISGSATLDLEGQTLNLKSGDSWLVPAGARHQYTITEPFTAVEATSPPAEVHGRDEAG